MATAFVTYYPFQVVIDCRRNDAFLQALQYVVWQWGGRVYI